MDMLKAKVTVHKEPAKATTAPTTAAPAPASATTAATVPPKVIAGELKDSVVRNEIRKILNNLL